MITGRGRQRRRRWRRAVARHRRLLAAGLLAGAVAAAVQARAPGSSGPAATEPVLVAAQDLPAGRTLGPADVRWQAWLPASVPRGTQRVVSGRVLASAVRAGEPITDARLAGPGLLSGQPAGTRAVTVRLADPSATALVRPGDRVDVLAAGPGTGPRPAAGSGAAAGAGAAASPGADPVDVLVEAAVVLGPAPGGCAAEAAGAGVLGGMGLDGGAAAPGCAGGPGSGVLVLAVDGAGARRLAGAVTDRSLSVAIRR